MRIYLLSFILTLSLIAKAQNVGIGTNAPDNSAILDLKSSSKGMLMPRLTTLQRKAISSPAAGLMLYDIDKASVMFFDGNAWRALSFADENRTEPQSRSCAQPALYAEFGDRVAISGDFAVIGAPRYSASGLNNMGLAYIFNKTSSGWKQVARLAAGDSTASDYFGGSVAISGDYAIIGCCTKKVNANINQGKAYVYHRNGTAWILDTALVKAGGQAYDDFGWSVGVCAFNSGGPGIAIGIPYSDVTGTDRGEVYFYTRKTDGKWSFVQNLSPTDLGNSDYYGAAITMDTDYVAIGANGQDNATYSYTDAGAAYVYAFGGGVWNFQQKLQGTTSKGQFGFALSLSSNMLAVGAPWATTYNNTSSSVFIYTRTGSAWSNSTYFFIYNFEIIPGAGQIQPASGSSAISIANITFGNSLCLSGNTILVGASGGIDYPNGGSSYYSDRVGAVYIYKNFSGNTFTRTNVITADFPTTGDLFGESVGISGNNYIVGAPHAIINGFVNAGNVYFGIQ